MTESLTNPRQEGDAGIIKLKATPKDVETFTEGEDVCVEPEIVKLVVDCSYHFDYFHGTESLSNSVANPPPVARTAGSLPTMRKANQKLARIRRAPPTDGTQQPSLQTYIIKHAKVFAIAVKYQIDGLRDLAASKCRDAATAHWDYDDFVHSI